MKRNSIFLFLALLCLAIAGCGGSSSDANSSTKNTTTSTTNSSNTSTTSSSTSSFPATEQGATDLIKEFAKPGADYAALSKKLRPTKADYEAIFESDLATKAEAVYTPAWDAGQLVVAPKEGQTEVKVFSTTTDDMKTWTGAAAEFPEGWKQVAPQLKPGVKIYRFKFVEPGKDIGMAYEGLAHVNGNWRIFPKPWRAMN